MLSINGMLGSAWLFAPLYAAKIAGSGAIIAWVIGGLATALIALTFAELSAMLPVAGGTAQIPQLSHGTFTSFTLSWLAWLSALTMAPIEVQAVLQYASTYFNSLTTIVNGVPTLTGLGLIWATILMLGLCIVNVISFKGLVRFNFILFLFKVAVIILATFYIMRSSFHVSNFQDLNSVNSIAGWQAILSAVATGGIAFAFTGFKHGVELAGETRRLNVAIPLAVVGSVLCCLLLYIGLQVAFIAAIDPNLLRNGWQQVNFIGDVGPFAGLAASLGLVWILKLLYFDAVVSPLGAGLIYVTSTARILYAMSEIGFVPRIFGYLNKLGLPLVAIIVNFVIGMFLFLPLPNWQSMVGFLVSGMVLSYAIGPVALLCLRLDLPDEKRIFKLPIARFISSIAFYCCTMISYWTGWETMYKLGVAMLFGFVVFLIAFWRGKLQHQHVWFKAAIWVVPYILGLIVFSYLGSFGGKNLIPFGWDFLVLGIFSMLILYFAVKYRHDSITVNFENFMAQQRLVESYNA
jgi:amino acid transporter